MDHGQLDGLIWPSVKAGQIGIVMSSFGLALQCMMVAPRLLASIAADGKLRPLTPLARLMCGEPKRALVGAACVLIGSLTPSRRC
jgi:potassium/chloride transporter 4/5/6